jgi:hypothetical protein
MTKIGKFHPRGSAGNPYGQSQRNERTSRVGKMALPDKYHIRSVRVSPTYGTTVDVDMGATVVGYNFPGISHLGEGEVLRIANNKLRSPEATKEDLRKQIQEALEQA